MDARQWWIVCNVVNTLTLSLGFYIAWGRLTKALYAQLLPHPDRSVNEMRDLNVAIARDQIFVNLGFLLLGVCLIGVAYLWPYFWPLPVPWPIPAGTAIFTVVWLGLTGRALWYAHKLDHIANLRVKEEGSRAQARTLNHEAATT